MPPRAPVAGCEVKTSLLAAAGFTVIADCVPVIEAVTVSVAVMDCVPTPVVAVFKVALKVCIPLSAVTKV